MPRRSSCFARRWATAALGVLLASGGCQFGDGEVLPQLGTTGSNARPVFWGLPEPEPCSLLTASEMTELTGVGVREARTVGTAIDGSACTYLTMQPFVVTVGLFSTAAYESLKIDVGGDELAGIGLDAFVRGPDSMGDVTLYARNRDAAVQVLLTGRPAIEGSLDRRRLTAAIARAALRRIEEGTS